MNNAIKPSIVGEWLKVLDSQYGWDSYGGEVGQVLGESKDGDHFQVELRNGALVWFHACRLTA